jgi:hypothetical protein
VSSCLFYEWEIGEILPSLEVWAVLFSPLYSWLRIWNYIMGILYLITRCKEHIRNIRFNKDESGFAQYILDKGHQYRPMEQIMEFIEYARKGSIMDIKENYYIYKFKQVKELIEEQCSAKDNDNQNSMFDGSITPISC